MIHIWTKNAAAGDLLAHALREWAPQPHGAGGAPDLIIACGNRAQIDSFLKKKPPCPVVVVGARHPKAVLSLPHPVSPAELRRHVRCVWEQIQKSHWENAAFVWNGIARQLTRKKNRRVIALTEKENDILDYLFHHDVTPRETLLAHVWKYHKDTQTHTVESHIYALRQKIGADADALIASSDAGYSIVR
ncbi:MAG: winged helix-turn-helix domain-containing protein [Alphaproteobacteria bacterium]|nr:winged helix-turn-helix domain-containing protein [Alphaproteobacteria bacterium]